MKKNTNISSLPRESTFFSHPQKSVFYVFVLSVFRIKLKLCKFSFYWLLCQCPVSIRTRQKKTNKKRRDSNFFEISHFTETRLSYNSLIIRSFKKSVVLWLVSHQYKKPTIDDNFISDKHDGFCAFKKIEFFVLKIVFSDSFADGVLITLIFFLNFYFRVN